MFDEIDFIEMIEQSAKNEETNFGIIAHYQNTHFRPIVFPKNITSFILGSLTSYKDSLKDILSELKIVDKSVVPDEPTTEPIPEDPEEQSK